MILKLGMVYTEGLQRLYEPRCEKTGVLRLCFRICKSWFSHDAAHIHVDSRLTGKIKFGLLCVYMRKSFIMEKNTANDQSNKRFMYIYKDHHC